MEEWIPNRYPGRCVLCHRPVAAGEGECRRTERGTGWEVRHRDGKCPGEPLPLNAPPARTRGAEMSREEAERLAAEQGRRIVSWEERFFTRGLPKKKYPSGRWGPNRDHMPKPGQVTEHGGRYYLIVQVGEPYFLSREDLEEFDRFFEEPGWKVDFRAVEVTPTREELEGRRKREEEERRKREEERRKEEEWREHIPRDHFRVSGGGVIQVVPVPAGEEELLYEWQDGSILRRYHRVVRVRTGEYSYYVHEYGDWDNWRRDVYLPPERVDEVMRKICEQKGITREKAEEWLREYRGCVGTEIYEWAARNL